MRRAALELNMTAGRRFRIGNPSRGDDAHGPLHICELKNGPKSGGGQVELIGRTSNCRSSTP